MSIVVVHKRQNKPKQLAATMAKPILRVKNFFGPSEFPQISKGIVLGVSRKQQH